MNAEPPASVDKTEVFVVYRRRWLVLVLFVFYAAANGFQWVQYSIVADIIMKYYGVPSTWVDWTSLVFMVSFLVLFVPCSYMLQRKSLRLNVLLAAIVTCLGCWIKAMAISPDRFWLAFLGQSIVSLSQVVVLSAPVKLAAVWFGSDQVSTACCLAVFGNQFGVTFAMVAVPQVILKHNDVTDIGSDLSTLSYSLAGACTLILVLIFFFFQEKPATAPSLAQKQMEENDIAHTPFISTIKAITNFPFILMMLTYGIGGGVINALATMFNQIITTSYSGVDKDVGTISSVTGVFGFVGVIFFGIVLDKIRKYKETYILVYIGCLISITLFAFAIHLPILYVYICSILIGFFYISFISIGYELAAELTYPEPEGTVGGLITCSLQLFAIILTMAYSELFYGYGDKVANGAMAGCFGLGIVMSVFIKNDLRRQRGLQNEGELAA